jgi:hypothetical protein
VTFEHTKGTACKEPRYHRRCTGRWRGMLDTGRNEAGKRSYRKVSGSTRQEVIDKLDAAKIEMAKGIRPKAGYTVAQTVRDWLGQWPTRPVGQDSEHLPRGHRAAAGDHRWQAAD